MTDFSSPEDMPELHVYFDDDTVSEEAQMKADTEGLDFFQMFYVKNWWKPAAHQYIREKLVPMLNQYVNLDPDMTAFDEVTDDVSTYKFVGYIDTLRDTLKGEIDELLKEINDTEDEIAELDRLEYERQSDDFETPPMQQPVDTPSPREPGIQEEAPLDRPTPTQGRPKMPRFAKSKGRLESPRYDPHPQTLTRRRVLDRDIGLDTPQSVFMSDRSQKYRRTQLFDEDYSPEEEEELEEEEEVEDEEEEDERTIEISDYEEDEEDVDHSVPGGEPASEHPPEGYKTPAMPPRWKRPRPAPRKPGPTPEGKPLARPTTPRGPPQRPWFWKSHGRDKWPRYAPHPLTEAKSRKGDRDIGLDTPQSVFKSDREQKYRRRQLFEDDNPEGDETLKDSLEYSDYDDDEE